MAAGGFLTREGERELGDELKRILDGLVPELESKMKLREEAISSSQRVTIQSKQAIMAVHAGDMEDAASKLEEAERIVHDLGARLATHSDLRRDSTNVAYQEYSEARVFEAAVLGRSFPTPVDLGIPTIPYVLGLADAVGEFRRRAVDALTKGQLKEAESSLRVMERIYNGLVPLEFFYSLAPELRRKVDVARHLIEATMGDIYTEKRRSSLQEAMRSLEKKLDGGNP